MILSVSHMMEYVYSKPIFIEPTTIRLRPRSDVGQRLHSSQMVISPQPAGITDCVDLDGNATSYAWFNGLQEKLTLSVMSTAEALRENPFDFVFPSERQAQLPMRYSPVEKMQLEAYMRRDTTDPEVHRFAAEIAGDADGDTMKFLINLTTRIADTFARIVREAGEARPSGQTLQLKKGACRDLAVLFMDSCKAVGIAVRFVSGYCHSEDKTSDRELHAWAEVYLPGGGWRGYDPSEGIAVTQGHIALAASPFPEGAAPISGAVRGDGAEAKLSYQVSISSTA
jgi:transglutaminase-like putative cysteine protease